MKKFEYKVLADESINERELENKLNKLGEEGWELAGIRTPANTMDTQLILKKEKPRDDFGQKPRFNRPRGNFSPAVNRFGSDKPRRERDGDAPQKRFDESKPRFDKTRTFTPKDRNFSDRNPRKDR